MQRKSLGVDLRTPLRGTLPYLILHPLNKVAAYTCNHNRLDEGVAGALGDPNRLEFRLTKASWLDLLIVFD